MFPKYVLLSICAFIWVHFGRPGKFSQHSPFRCTHTFSKTSYDQWFFFSKKSWKSSLFKSMSVFQLNNLFFFFFFLFFFCFSYLLSYFLICSLFPLFFYIIILFFYLFVLLFIFLEDVPKHVYIFVRYFCYIHAYPRYLAT